MQCRQVFQVSAGSLPCGEGNSKLSVLSTPQPGPGISAQPHAQPVSPQLQGQPRSSVPVLQMTETIWVGEGLQRGRGYRGAGHTEWTCQGPNPSACL